MDGSSEVLANAMVSAAQSPRHQLSGQERLEQVQRELDDLPARDREILVMRNLEHLRIEAIAELLGVTPGAAKARILRALLKMRDLLGTEP